MVVVVDQIHPHFILQSCGALARHRPDIIKETLIIYQERERDKNKIELLCLHSKACKPSLRFLNCLDFLLSLRLHLHLLCQLCIFFVSYSKSSVNHSLGIWQLFFSIYNGQFEDAKMGKMQHSIWTNSVTDRTEEEHL